MGMKEILLVSVAISLAATVANANVGPAVYHTHNTPSACYGNRNDGAYITGVSADLWDNRGACGRTYSVSCIGSANEFPQPCKPGIVVVKVTDLCNSCTGDLNLSQEAFESIADLRAGKVQVRYDQIK